ncbi:MAG: T9SS type A sorting domain-containing protein [Bacteroidetes bacterium]|nr:T9SS type A sorting domain-containing protein [Bacteroidota bacterium]
MGKHHRPGSIGLNKGIYFCKVKSNGNLQTTKIIKN